jgi:membrane protein
MPAGALTAVCAGAYAIATTVYTPRLMATYSQRYGLFGVTLALIGWLLCVALIIVAATVVAAEFDRTPGRLGHAPAGQVRSGTARRRAGDRQRIPAIGQ